MNRQYDGLALFSGGLDGLLAIKVLEEQGLKIKPLHFYSPFFGYPRKRAYWRRIYGIDAAMIDISQDFVDMLAAGPLYGVGKVINPCVDCKILLLQHARKLMPQYGARFLATGEVVGQRPMSQRRDTLDIISRDAQIRDVLLRPLSAQCLRPTAVEESGLVDRSRLLDLWGRGRKGQFELAAKYGIKIIPTPAGGCLLTEKENGSRFWPIFKHLERPDQSHFWLAKVGRQFWNGPFWLSIGRNERDNARLNELLQRGDILLRLTSYPGPLALARNLGGEPWPYALLEAAGALLGSFSPKAAAAAAAVEVQLRTVGPHWDGADMQALSLAAPELGAETERVMLITPQRSGLWHGVSWEEAGPEIKAHYKI